MNSFLNGYFKILKKDLYKIIIYYVTYFIIQYVTYFVAYLKLLQMYNLLNRQIFSYY